jgi:hypothetical protein
MSDHLDTARAKLARGDFSAMSPMELEALAKWSAGVEAAPKRRSHMLPPLIEAILDLMELNESLSRETKREELQKYLEDRVIVSLEKTWTEDDFKGISR